MKHITSLAIAMLFSASSSAAYKCVSAEGAITDQERPCEIERGRKAAGVVGGDISKSQSPVSKASAPQVSQEELLASVRGSLKDPDSANFKDLQHVGDGRALCGQVNAKNSYGGFAGFKRFVADFEGVYWAGDGSAQIDIGKPEARRTYVPKAHFWGCAQ